MTVFLFYLKLIRIQKIQKAGLNCGDFKIKKGIEKEREYTVYLDMDFKNNFLEINDSVRAKINKIISVITHDYHKHKQCETKLNSRTVFVFPNLLLHSWCHENLPDTNTAHLHCHNSPFVLPRRCISLSSPFHTNQHRMHFDIWVQ